MADILIWKNGDAVPRNKFRRDSEYVIFLFDGSQFFAEFISKSYHGHDRVLSRRPVTASFWVTWGPGAHGHNSIDSANLLVLDLQEEVEAIYSTGRN